MNTLGSRIKKVKDHLEVKQKGLADILEVKIDRVKSLESDKVKDLTAREANILVKNFHFNIEWLLSGEGKMLLNESDNFPAGAVTVNLYEDVYAAAGHGAENEHFFPPVPIQISAEVLRDVFNVHYTKHVDIINVSGDSMEPFFHHGDRIIVERTHEASDNNIVIALVDGQLFVKRLLKDPLGRWVKLTSTNEFYPDIPLEGEEIDRLRIIGIVRGKWRPI